MKLPIVQLRLTDDELVARLARRFHFYGRMRWWIATFCGFVAACHIAVFFAVSKMLMDGWAEVELDDVNAPFYLGSLAGGFLGLGLGLSLSSVLAGLMHYLGEHRIAKLLTEHYKSHDSVAS